MQTSSPYKGSGSGVSRIKTVSTYQKSAPPTSYAASNSDPFNPYPPAIEYAGCFVYSMVSWAVALACNISQTLSSRFGLIPLSWGAGIFCVCNRLRKKALRLLWSRMPDTFRVIYAVVYALVWTVYQLIWSIDAQCSRHSQVLCCRYHICCW